MNQTLRRVRSVHSRANQARTLLHRTFLPDTKCDSCEDQLFVKTKTRARNVHCFGHIVMTNRQAWGEQSSRSPSFLAAGIRLHEKNIYVHRASPGMNSWRKWEATPSNLSDMVRLRWFKSLYIMTIEKIRRYIHTYIYIYIYISDRTGLS